MGDIRNLMYGIGITSFVIIISMIFMAQSNDKYGSEYDSSNVEVYNKLDELNNISKDMRINSNKSLNSNPLDVLGEFFKTGYTGMKLTTKSIDIADDLSNNAIEDANLGETGGGLRVLATTLLVIFVIGTLIAVAVGRDW